MKDLLHALENARKEHRHALIQLSIARQMWVSTHPNHCTTCEGSGKVADGEDCYECLEHEINPLDILQCGVDVDYIGLVAISTFEEMMGVYVLQEESCRSAYYNARLEYEREQLGEDQWR
jgi:hypothetical protein